MRRAQNPDYEDDEDLGDLIDSNVKIMGEIPNRDVTAEDIDA